MYESHTWTFRDTRPYTASGAVALGRTPPSESGTWSPKQNGSGMKPRSNLGPLIALVLVAVSRSVVAAPTTASRCTPDSRDGCPDTPVVVVGSAVGVAGEEVTFAVTFQTSGTKVSGLQNDISFDPNTAIVACVVNPDLGKNLTGFALHGTLLRAVVNGLNIEEPLPDGAVLYTCSVFIAADAAPGVYPLVVSNVIASDSAGNRIDPVGESGQVVVTTTESGATPIPTRTPTGTPTTLPTVPGDAVVSLEAGTAIARAGDRVRIPIVLNSGGYPISLMQNDLLFDPAVAIAANENGRPDCTPNPDATRDFAAVFLPEHCNPTTDCIGVRTEAAAIPAAQKTILYSCTVVIGSDVPPGRYPLVVANQFVDDFQANLLPAKTSNGEVEVVTLPNATPRVTWTVTPSPTSTPTPAPFGELEVSTVHGAPGETVTVAVTLHAGTAVIAGTENDIEFDRINARIARNPDGSPDCAVNAQIRKPATTFSFQPHGCSGVGCFAIRALVFAFDTLPIPDGLLLYTCTVNISAQAEANFYPLRISNVALSDPQGNEVVSAATNGGIIVGDGAVTANPPPGPVGFPPSAEPPPTWTPGLLPLTGVQRAEAADGGCSVSANRRPVRGREFLHLLLPAALLVWRRRAKRG